MIRIFLPVLCLLLANRTDAQKEISNNVLPKTALIKLKITKQGDAYNILVKDITVINDEKQRNVKRQDNATNNGLVALVLDKGNAIIDSLIINEPLVTRYEYPNEDGTIGSKEVELNEREIILRCAYNPRMQYLQILKVTEKKTKKTLATIKLPNPEP